MSEGSLHLLLSRNHAELGYLVLQFKSAAEVPADHLLIHVTR